MVGECWLLRARGEVWEAVGVLTERTKKRSVKPRVNFNVTSLEQGINDGTGVIHSLKSTLLDLAAPQQPQPR